MFIISIIAPAPQPAFATAWGERPADQVLNEAFHSDSKWNESHYSNPEFDRLLEAARAELDFDRRRQLYLKAQDYLAMTSGTLIPFHVTQLVVLSNRVTHFDPVQNDALRSARDALALVNNRYRAGTASPAPSPQRGVGNPKLCV